MNLVDGVTNRAEVGAFVWVSVTRDSVQNGVAVTSTRDVDKTNQIGYLAITVDSANLNPDKRELFLVIPGQFDNTGSITGTPGGFGYIHLRSSSALIIRNP